MSDYKPGTIAKATVRGVPDVTVMRLETDLWVSAAAVETRRTHPLDGSVTDVHPLVVLDLTGAQIARLTDTLRDFDESPSIREALHQIERQTRPAIEEPKGLGAVVEDTQGDRLTRYCDASDDGEWIGTDGRSWKWGALDAVRVLSPGVEP